MNIQHNVSPQSLTEAAEAARDLRFSFKIEATCGDQRAFNLEGVFDMPVALLPGSYPASAAGRFEKVFDVCVTSSAQFALNHFLDDWWKKEQSKKMEKLPLAPNTPRTFADLSGPGDKEDRRLQDAARVRRAA